ncbi:MAG: lysine--tRNA ligase [Ammonifex sp.]|jgi:lysyl-tRNA synthetase class 2|nr:MAG: lysine--tRNA ligase [Ammonifex sp.]
MREPEGELDELLQIRREKLHEFEQLGIRPYGGRYETTHSALQIITDFETLEGKEVKIAGRLVGKRGHGKASFGDIQDFSGRIQIHVRQDEVGAENYQVFKKVDIGDILGVGGTVFRTKMGEITVGASTFTLLAKSLRPLPEKWHGLKDVELRSRQRYLDLIVNPEVKSTFILRSKIIHAIRRFLDDRGFLEVETPMMQPIPGGAAARPFVTYHNALNLKLYLRIAPELYLKRLLVGGFEKVYEINRNFRNEGISTRHNPEFTMLELYQAYADYHDMMDLTEELISSVTHQVVGTHEITRGEEKLSLAAPWPRLSYLDLVKEKSGIDFSQLDVPAARRAASTLGVHVEDKSLWGEALNAVFEELVEPNLTAPTFVVDYPVDISPLAKRKTDDPRLTYRFELFIAGREIANAFSELNDPLDQGERFSTQLQKRQAGDEEAHMFDEDFVTALEYGMPPAGGLGIGIDRLVMLLANVPSIREVILFPLHRPRD